MNTNRASRPQTRQERIGPHDGLWRRCRKAFKCAQCPATVAPGSDYYDTCEGDGMGHFFSTIKLCSACADEVRDRAMKLALNQHRKG